MSLSGDEPDDGNDIFDQLKSIRPFTVGQLFSLFPDIIYTPTPFSQLQDAKNIVNYDKTLFEDLIDYEQLRLKLNDLEHDIRKSHHNCLDHLGKAWIIKSETFRKIGMCQQGKIANLSIKYEQASIDTKQLQSLDGTFTELIETVSKDYMHYSFESQMKLYKIKAKISLSNQIHEQTETETDNEMSRLKSMICTLIDFIKHLGQSKSEFLKQYRKWLRTLIRAYLKTGRTEDYKYIISQLCKGPAKTSLWSADLIECKPYSETTHFNSEPEYIGHCCTLLSEIFGHLRLRIGQTRSTSVSTSYPSIENQANSSTLVNVLSSQSWSIVDAKFTSVEEVDPIVSNITFAETDIINYCLRIPVVQIFREYVKTALDQLKLDSDNSRTNCENLMLEFLTLGTIIIKTYQNGLETFDKIQFSNLIEYLSHQIRSTVIILSDQWAELKRRLKRSPQNILLMRLQVEYDNFILRSILIILELRQNGIWKHLSSRQDSSGGDLSSESLIGWSTSSLKSALNKVTDYITSSKAPTSETLGTRLPNQAGSPIARHSPLTHEFSLEWFKEVSEPMLWHILWQFYHNAFMSSCDYNGDNYWLGKFREKSVIYLLIDKIRYSSTCDRNFMLNSMTNMLLSCSSQNSVLVSFIATEILDLSFKKEATRDKVYREGTKCLIRSAEKFPRLISLYMAYIEDNEDSDPNIVAFMKGCHLNGWLCTYDELDLISNWLLNNSLDSVKNKVARIIITKLVLNSPETKNVASQLASSDDGQSVSSDMASSKNRRYLDIHIRRKLAVLFYEASVKHKPEIDFDFTSRLYGDPVESALGQRFDDKLILQLPNQLINLAADDSYEKFYIWIWHLLYSFRLHILNQPDTDWNDVKCPSGTSRSIKNTVLLNDSFHPSPSIHDCECQILGNGVDNKHPMALFIYMLMTDISWQNDCVNLCLDHLNIMVNAGYITPSLIVMEFVTICHINDLNTIFAKDQQCLAYFTSLIGQQRDMTRLAALISSQMQHLKQYRQLQLSHFYIQIFLDISVNIVKQSSFSWFGDERGLEKIAALLDGLVKLNFSTQRNDIIRKFYDCSYSMQDCLQSGNWLGNLFSSPSSPSSPSNAVSSNGNPREYTTMLHHLTKKYKQYHWLRWITIECDSLRLERIWEDMVAFLSTSEGATLESAIKKICPQIPSLKSMLPIYSYMKQIFDIVETDPNHPLCPIIWYNFFLNYFANSLNGVSVGNKLVSQDKLILLTARLESLNNYHTYKQRYWTPTTTNNSSHNNNSPNRQQNPLGQFYKAARLWLQDRSLQDAYVEMDRLGEDYLVPLFKAIIECSSIDACLQYIDLRSIHDDTARLSNIWLHSTRLALEELLSSSNNDITLKANVLNDGFNRNLASPSQISLQNHVAAKQQMTQANNLDTKIVMGDEHQAEILEDQVASFKTLAANEDDLNKSSYEFPNDFNFNDAQSIIDFIQNYFSVVLKESLVFKSNIQEIDKIRKELLELIQDLYVKRKKERVKLVPCSDGQNCINPAKIKFEIEEAAVDDRKRECIHDRQEQCEIVLNELILMPNLETIKSAIMIEHCISKLILQDGPQSEQVIKLLANWIREKENFEHLNGPYYPANHLLKVSLDLLADCKQKDAFNGELLDLCSHYPSGLQLFSPHFCPGQCSQGIFLELYKQTAQFNAKLGPMALFVLLSKFDLNNWFNAVRSEQLKEQMIIATCSALGQLGQQPDDLYALTFDLYRKHIRIELNPSSAGNKIVDRIGLVLEHFLKMMNEQTLAPNLWSDLLEIIGIERHKFVKSNTSANLQSTTQSLISGLGARDESMTNRLNRLSIATMQLPQETASVSSFNMNSSTTQSNQINPFLTQSSEFDRLFANICRFAEKQTILDYKSIDALMSKIIELITAKENVKGNNITLIELHQLYLDQFSVLMLSVSFIWIKQVSDTYPDNHTLIWKQFMLLWSAWIFLKKNCQNVAKSSYILVSNYFVASIRYMLVRLPDNQQLILRSLLNEMALYVSQTEQVVYLEFYILQNSLKSIPWSGFLMSVVDFANLAILSRQNNFNVTEFVSHIVMQVNIKESLAQIKLQLEKKHSIQYASSTDQNVETIMGQVAEDLATCIIFQSTHLKGFRLSGVDCFSSIPAQRISPLAMLTLQRMEFANLEHNQNNKLLVSLIRFACIKFDQTSQKNNGPIDSPSSDDVDRSIVYANFISSYLVDLLSRHPSLISISKHDSYLKAVFESTLNDLRLLSSAEVTIDQKSLIYENLLECCCSPKLDEETRLFLAKTMIETDWLKDKPIIMMEIFHVIGKIISHPETLVFMIEKMAILYLVTDGHYEKVWKSFSMKVLPSDLYLEACVRRNSALPMLIYFESITQAGSMQNQRHLTDRSNQGTNCLDNSLGSTSGDYFSQDNIIWTCFFHWAAELTSTLDKQSSMHEIESSELHTIIALLGLINLLKPHLERFINTDQSSINTKHRQQEIIVAKAADETAEQENLDQETASKHIAPDGQQQQPHQQQMLRSHRALLDLIERLIGCYDSKNSTGLWSYLNPIGRNGESQSKFGLISLAIASFLAYRSLYAILSHDSSSSLPTATSSPSIINPTIESSAATSIATITTTTTTTTKEQQQTKKCEIQTELIRLRKVCLMKLEASRKSRQYQDSLEFIEAFIESLARTDRVEYFDVVQLIITYVKNQCNSTNCASDDLTCLNKLTNYYQLKGSSMNSQ